MQRAKPEGESAHLGQEKRFTESMKKTRLGLAPESRLGYLNRNLHIKQKSESVILQAVRKGESAHLPREERAKNSGQTAGKKRSLTRSVHGLDIG